jgi:hypothetical protein
VNKALVDAECQAPLETQKKRVEEVEILTRAHQIRLSSLNILAYSHFGIDKNLLSAIIAT